jgi:hypothetical protein
MNSIKDSDLMICDIYSDSVYSLNCNSDDSIENLFDNKLLLNTQIELNKNDPDYHIENFWYGFKQSMINFYTKHNLNYINIYEWSNKLNKLKIDKKYNDIENSIREYISIYAKCILKHSYDLSYYDDDILISNIKRWNKISCNYNFDKSNIHNKLLIVFLVILEIKKSKKNINDNIEFIDYMNNEYDDIDDIINNNNYDDFIIYGFDKNKSKILELLKIIPEYDLFNRIKILFSKIPLNNYKNIKMEKICKLYMKLYK